jgi:hypothetical protein
MVAINGRQARQGHNWQRGGLPLCLPGNGGLLLAVAHMARLGAFPRADRSVRVGGNFMSV